MRRVLFPLIFAVAAHEALPQRIFLVDYSSFCQGPTYFGGKNVQERIHSIDRIEGFWVIQATISGVCGLKLYPSFKLQGDTLYVETHEIIYQTSVLDIGDTIQFSSSPQECACAYQISLKFNADTIENVKINGKTLPITDEVFKTHAVAYFIYKGDTTGYTDKYGVRQGLFIYERKNGKILKVRYVDNQPTWYQLYDNAGKLLEEAKDFESIKLE